VSCRTPACNDGLVDPGEECDDGNDVNGDECDVNCTTPRCGNGVAHPGERCLGTRVFYPFVAGSVEGADLDGDGTAEILAATPAGVQAYRHSPEARALVPFVTLSGPVNAITMTARDLDGDGALDVVGGGFGFVAHLNLGGSPPTFQSFASLDPSQYVFFATTGVLRSGGLPDLVRVWSEGVQVVRNLDGAFTPQLEMLTGDNAYGAVVVDVDDDTDNDIVVVHANFPDPTMPYLVVLRNDGDGLLTADAPIVLPGFMGPNTIDAGDLDGDGVPELVVANHDSREITVIARDTTNDTYSIAYEVPLGGISHSAVARDIDQDGDVDVVAAVRDANQLAILYNVGSRVDAEEPEVQNLGDCPRTVAVADFDGNGAVDIAASNAPDQFFCAPPEEGGLTVIYANP
jgi:cysteine-rich repeat protein